MKRNTLKVARKIKEKQEIQPNKGDDILEAALELFTKKGFDGTPVPLIAKKANVASGTIYRYFDSKEELVNSLFQKWQEKLFLTITSTFPSKESARIQFAHIWQSMAEFQRNFPLAFDFLEMQYNLPYLDKTSIEKRIKLLKFLCRFAYTNRHKFRPFSPDVLIAIVWGAFVGLVKASVSKKILLDSKLLQETEESLWVAIQFPK